jgi:hypothetical protein
MDAIKRKLSIKGAGSALSAEEMRDHLLVSMQAAMKGFFENAIASGSDIGRCVCGWHFPLLLWLPSLLQATS